MDKVILILLILIFLGFFYSFLVEKLSKSKIIMAMPTILGIVLLLYNKISSNPNNFDGLEAINILLKEFIIVAIIAGNILGLIFFTLRK